MRELVRGLLALLLAVGMSTVFVGCDVDDGEEGAGGAEAGGAEEAAGGGEEEAGGAEEEEDTSGADEVIEMMSMVPDTEEPNGGLGDGCRETGGGFGYCANTDRSDQGCEDNGGHLVTGVCDGGANIVCCVGYQCGPSSDPDAGVCAPEASCDVAGGSSVQSGLCPGGSDIKCCLPSADAAVEMTAEEGDDAGDDAGDDTAAAGGSADDAADDAGDDDAAATGGSEG